MAPSLCWVTSQMPHTDIRDMLLGMSRTLGSGEVTEDHLQRLNAVWPTPSEIACVQQYKGDVDRLGVVERFVRAVMHVPNASGRIAGLLYWLQFEERVAALTGRADRVALACHQVRSRSSLEVNSPEALTLHA